MNSNKVLIITVLLAALIIGAAIIYATMGARQAPAPAAPSLQGQAMTEQVIVPAVMTKCKDGDRCVVVDTTCSFCCKYVPINAAHEKLFDELFADHCTGFSGTMCECFDLTSYPKCVNGECTMVKFEDTP
jgi:hypothetical protein